MDATLRKRFFASAGCLSKFIQVFYLFFCETLNTGFDVYLIYEPLVQRYGEYKYSIFKLKLISRNPLDTDRALRVVPLSEWKVPKMRWFPWEFWQYSITVLNAGKPVVASHSELLLNKFELFRSYRDGNNSSYIIFDRTNGLNLGDDLGSCPTFYLLAYQDP